MGAINSLLNIALDLLWGWKHQFLLIKLNH